MKNPTYKKKCKGGILYKKKRKGGKIDEDLLSKLKKDPKKTAKKKKSWVKGGYELYDPGFTKKSNSKTNDPGFTKKKAKPIGKYKNVKPV